MGIDLATWRARIGLNYYHVCHPFQTRCRSSGGRLYQPGVASWGVGEVMNDTPMVLKSCMAIVALSLILQYIAHACPKLKGRGGGGKLRCHWCGTTPRMRGIVGGGRTLLLKVIVVVIPLLLMMAGDVELNPGPPKMEGAALTLKAAINALHSASFRWYQIGVQLDVPTHSLKNIKQQFHDPIDCLTELLDYWMRNATDPPPSWRALIDALKAPSVGENRLAGTLEEKYCKQKEQDNSSEEFRNQDGTGASCMSSMRAKHVRVLGDQFHEPDLESSTTYAARQKGIINSPSSKRSEKPPFGCGCSNCTFFTYIVSGCPKPLPSASSFPYLDLSELTLEQQLVLRGRLQKELKTITIQFQYLVSTTLKSLEEQHVTVKDFIPHIKALGTYKPVIKDSKVPVFQERLKDLENAEDISTIFQILYDYMSFFNYHIIEHIISVLGTATDKARLQSYKTNFQQYAKRRVCECPPEFGPVSKVGHADIFVKVDSEYEIYTVAEIEEFRQTLSELLSVSTQGVLRLCRVEKGCFQLTFQVPSFVREEVFPLSREQERALADEGVISLVCGEYQFQNWKDEPPQAGVDKNSQDDDDESGMGPSISTTIKTTTVSEDPLDRELKELDYELRVQGLVESASNHEYWSHFELHLAVLTGQLEAVKFLVEENSYNPMHEHLGINAVHMAALYGKLHVFKYFITERNCNPACPGPYGLTPLHLASEQGHLDMVRYLVIEQQLDPLCEDEYGSTALHRACAGGCQPVVELLSAELQKYNPIAQIISELTNKWNSTPLHTAVAHGHLNIVNFLVSNQNCDPNVLGQYDATPLQYAAECGHLHMVKYLTDEQGCNPSCSDDMNHTPLHQAAAVGHVDIVKFLTVEKHCDPMCRDSDQNIPLHEAARNGHIDVVKFLTLEMHCDPTSRNANNATALHLAVANGHLDIVEFFISEQNCDPNIPGQYGRTPLHYAAEFSHLHIVKYLIDELGCNPSCLDELNHTPLHLAAQEGHMDIVKFLTVEKLCDPMCRDSEQDTPLHYAVQSGHIDVVKFLTVEMHLDPTSRTNQNCDPNVPGQYGRTPLHYAAWYGHLHIVKYFTDEQGCNPSCLDDWYRTPLHWAAMEGYMNLVKFLTVEKHCDPMFKDCVNDIPLHLAVREGHLQVVTHFVEELKCPPDIIGQQNSVPLQMAIMKHPLEIAQYLHERSVIPFIFIAIDMIKQLPWK